jgi:transcriptional regulator with XRE-family HTH domain
LQISIAISEDVATGRAIAAARMLLGLDQAALAALAKVSAATISNVEYGHGARDETILAIHKAIRRRGATIIIDRSNGFASVAIIFHQPRITQRTPRSASLKFLNYKKSPHSKGCRTARRDQEEQS